MKYKHVRSMNQHCTLVLYATRFRQFSELIKNYEKSLETIVRHGLHAIISSKQQANNLNWLQQPNVRFSHRSITKFDDLVGHTMKSHNATYN